MTLFRKAIEQKRPGSGIKVIGAGISGNKVPILKTDWTGCPVAQAQRCGDLHWHQRCVALEEQPGTPIDRFESGLTKLVERCNKAGARVILATPSVIGEKTDGSNELDKMLEEYSAVSRKVAAATARHCWICEPPSSPVSSRTTGREEQGFSRQTACI